ncbi:hypothetical protein LCGC14_0443420 [marine sediment metagenome]|uniref:Uncharacterized protein n=1 Tax=marine sediment metagenome TaxID=412755 RepID=A0A0F9V6J7_9ZZZZ
MLNVMVEVRRLIDRRHRQTHFFADVATYTAGPPPTATIIRNGQTVADGQEYEVADEVAVLVADDRVIVLDVTGEGGLVITHKMP